MHFVTVHTHCSQPWHSHRLHQDSLCPRHTSSVEAHTCGSRGTGKPQGCRSWILWRHYGKVTWWYNVRKCYAYSQMPPLGMGESNISECKISLTAFLVLIRTIATVIGAVTHPVAGNAAVVPTFKLSRCTEFVWKGGQKERHYFYLL